MALKPAQLSEGDTQKLTKSVLPNKWLGAKSRADVSVPEVSSPEAERLVVMNTESFTCTNEGTRIALT